MPTVFLYRKIMPWQLAGTSRHISNQSDNLSEREEWKLINLMKELEEQPNYPIHEAIKEYVLKSIS